MMFLVIIWVLLSVGVGPKFVHQVLSVGLPPLEILHSTI